MLPWPKLSNDLTEINFHSTEGKEISDPSFPILLLSRHSTTTFLTPDSHRMQNGHPCMDEHNEPSAVSSDSVFFGVEAGSESSSADKTGSICLPGLNQRFLSFLRWWNSGIFHLGNRSFSSLFLMSSLVSLMDLPWLKSQPRVCLYH